MLLDWLAGLLSQGWLSGNLLGLPQLNLNLCLLSRGLLHWLWRHSLGRLLGRNILCNSRTWLSGGLRLPWLLHLQSLLLRSPLWLLSLLRDLLHRKWP